MRNTAGAINVKGYTTPRAFSGFQVPITLQSLAIRRYCEDRGFLFNIHANENITPDSYLVLKSVIEDSRQYQAVAMCSIGMLPQNRRLRTELLCQALANGMSIHFVFEQMVVVSPENFTILDELTSLCNLIPTDLQQIKSLQESADYE